MEDRNFPKKLEQAYARVVERVLRNPREPERIVAKKILGWVTCAQRPLRWREIQSLFCIDPRTGTANMRSLPSDSCKYYCSSLVDITGCNDDANEGRVELVHISAKHFLIHTDSVCLATEHAKMALFNSQYLTSRPFEAQTVDDIKNYALDGYYNLHDYAVTSWWYHANESFEHITSCPADIFAQMVESLSKHLQQHFPARADETVRDSTFDQVLVDFRQLSADHRTREKSGSLGQRSGAFREVLETLWISMLREASTKDSIGLQLLGPMRYKCPHSWCHFFENGFLQRTQRDDHIEQHDRPFRCTVEGCYAANLGFSSQQQLQQHDRRQHQEPDRPRFSVSKKPKEYKTVWTAIADGVLEAVEAVVQRETAKSNSFSLDERCPGGFVGKGYTALEYAVHRGKYDICQYLLSAGASPVGKALGPGLKSPDFPSALDLALRKNDADITYLLISHYRSTHPLASLGNETDKLLLDVSAEVRNAFVNALEIYRRGIELNEYWLMHAFIIRQPEWIKSYYLQHDGIKKKRTILQLLKENNGLYMSYIMGTSEECFQTFLSYESEQEAINQIFFEACATGNELILSRLPSMKPELSEWWAFKEYLSFFSTNHEHLESSHPLMRVIERLKPRNFWNMFGTNFRFLPLEPWIRDLSRSAMREWIRTDDTLLLNKDGQNSTLLHGYILRMTLIWWSPSYQWESTFHPMYRPEDMRDQEMLSEADKEKYEESLRPFWEILTEDLPGSMVYETAKENLTDLSRKIWDERKFDVFLQYGDASYTPIRLALDLPTWNGKAIAYALLNTGLVDISTGSIPDELHVLVAAAKTRDNKLMEYLIHTGRSKLCSTATEDEAHHLMLHLPRNATDLLVISALESGDEIVSRELEIIQHVDGAENFFLIDSLVRREEFLIARELVLRKPDNFSMGSAEREALVEYAVETDDLSLLRKLMNEDLIDTAIFLIAANGSPNLFNAVPRNEREIQNVRRNDGMTPQQVAQFHQNCDVEHWFAERDYSILDLYVDLDSYISNPT
ncbi:hypothetical protein E8E14_005978 [Neopestalotiopsis sp. 37M]|nr:hypothetical protein E8E14_005978 [Neopestalotiopsis sp. 37M]